MSKPKLPPEFLKLCKAVTAKRPKTVIDHILRHGFITTQELKDRYGCNHPPRAVRDVKEHGLPIEMFRVEGSDGRKIAAYRFGDPSKARSGQQLGRTVLSKELKQKLVALHGKRCAIYLEQFPERELQVDHRIPFEVQGDVPGAEPNPDDYMLLCGSANRAKSWSCEHCVNWLELKKPDICYNMALAKPNSPAPVGGTTKHTNYTKADTDVSGHGRMDLLHHPAMQDGLIAFFCAPFVCLVYFAVAALCPN